MIQWCAYCQRFIGEVEPVDEYGLSHGICAACRAREAFRDPTIPERLDPLISFYRELRNVAVSALPVNAAEILSTARRHGIQPLDLLMGVLQPLLYEVGVLWSRGELSVATEHRFSALTGALIHLVRPGLEDTRGASGAAHPDVLLLSAADNYHTFGLQMAEAYFLLSGVNSRAFYPALPAVEAVALAREFRPRILGFSVALLPQMRYVRETVDALARDSGTVSRVLVGGPVVRMGLRPDPSFPFEIVRDLRQVVV